MLSFGRTRFFFFFLKDLGIDAAPKAPKLEKVAPPGVFGGALLINYQHAIVFADPMLRIVTLLQCLPLALYQYVQTCRYTSLVDWRRRSLVMLLSRCSPLRRVLFVACASAVRLRERLAVLHGHLRLPELVGHHRRQNFLRTRRSESEHQHIRPGERTAPPPPIDTSATLFPGLGQCHSDPAQGKYMISSRLFGVYMLNRRCFWSRS